MSGGTILPADRRNTLGTVEVRGGQGPTTGLDSELRGLLVRGPSPRITFEPAIPPTNKAMNAILRSGRGHEQGSA